VVVTELAGQAGVGEGAVGQAWSIWGGEGIKGDPTLWGGGGNVM